VRGRAERGERAKDVAVDLARVGLAGDRVGVREAEELGHAGVEGLDLVVVTIKEGKERGLGAGRALDATEAEVVACARQVAQVPEKLLEPKRSPLADGRQLGRLEVGEAERRQVLVLLGEGRQARDDGRELVEQEREAVAQEDEVGVTARSGGRCVSTRADGRSMWGSGNVLGDEARGGAEASSAARAQDMELTVSVSAPRPRRAISAPEHAGRTG